MFSKGKTKTLQQLIGDAGINIPAPIIKALQGAIDRYQSAKADRSEAIAATAENETKRAGFNESFEALKASLAAEIANGSKTPADVAADLRASRDEHDLADVAAAGLQIRAQRAEDVLSESIAALIDAHQTFKLAATEAVRKLLIEKAAPFTAAVRRCMAVDASLRVELGGLRQNRIADPGIVGQDLEIDPELINNFDWTRDAEAIAISNSLDLFGNVILEARHEANRADERRAELVDIANREATRRSQQEREARGLVVHYGPGGNFLGDAA